MKNRPKQPSIVISSFAKGFADKSTPAEREREALRNLGAPVDDPAALRRYMKARAAVQRAVATLDRHARENPMATRAHTTAPLWAALYWNLHQAGMPFRDPVGSPGNLKLKP